MRWRRCLRKLERRPPAALSLSPDWRIGSARMVLAPEVAEPLERLDRVLAPERLAQVSREDVKELRSPLDIGWQQLR